MAELAEWEARNAASDAVELGMLATIDIIKGQLNQLMNEISWLFKQ
jgi:hypothetical protein